MDELQNAKDERAGIINEIEALDNEAREYQKTYEARRSELVTRGVELNGLIKYLDGKNGVGEARPE